MERWLVSMLPCLARVTKRVLSKVLARQAIRSQQSPRREAMMSLCW